MAILAGQLARQRWLNWVIPIAVSVTSISPSHGASAIPQYKKIEYLATALGEADRIKEISDNNNTIMLNRIRRNNPNITTDQIEIIKQIHINAFNAIELGLEKAIIDAFGDTFSDSEIDAMYEFYQSDVGRSIASKQRNFRSITRRNFAYWILQYNIELKKTIRRT